MFSLADRLDYWNKNAPDTVWAQSPDILQLVQASEYAAGLLCRYSHFAALLAADNENPPHWLDFDFARDLSFIRESATELDLMRDLRIKKQEFDCRLIYAVVVQKLPQTDFLVALSRLADELVDIALSVQFRFISQKHGIPLDEQGRPFTLAVLAMGKLGGRELNFSSDIDLIFAYRNNGETAVKDGQKSLANEVFFRKLAQKLIYTLDHHGEHGIVYRVDMRLRPFGQTGPLALSFDACENYYQIHGRDWERYAMMKARPIAGDISGAEELLSNLRPFVYRRYLDYAAINSIAEMKEQINRQIHERGIEEHIKLGRGGIREAEFSVQAVQLVYGGQYPKIQKTSFLTSLAEIDELNLWEHGSTEDLRAAYLLLREVENALQFDRCQQTHQLPDTEHAWKRLALACGFNSAESLQHSVKSARDQIHDTFRRIFPSAKANDENTDNAAIFKGISWQEPDENLLTDLLIRLREEPSKAAEISRAILEFAKNINWQKLANSTINRIEKLLPLLLENSARQHNSVKSLKAVLDLINKVASRSVYIEILSGDPELLQRLLSVAENSSWLMDFICEHPLVIDDILSDRNRISSKNELQYELAARLENLDEEEWLTALRDFKHAQIFKIAWAEIHNRINLMVASDKLTEVAEIIISTITEKARNILNQKYGKPRDKNGNLAQFAVLAYGKLGGWELSYASDLDLVFIYDDARSAGSTDGEKSIANQIYFTRLMQRITSYLSAPSTSGILYHSDTRLRPGGQSGMPASSIENLSEYLKNRAWTWEKQALTRARALAGDDELCAKFENLRREILQTPPQANLKEDVINMREKMHKQNPIPAQVFHLKKSQGGLVDIEFIVQYLLLQYSHQEEVLIRNTDNIRQLAALEAVGILSSLEAMNLRDAYRTLRRACHLRALNNQNEQSSLNDWKNTAKTVRKIYDRIFSINKQSENL